VGGGGGGGGGAGGGAEVAEREELIFRAASETARAEDRSTRIAAAIRAAAIARARGTHLVDADVLLVVLAVPLRPAVEIPPPAVDRRLVVAATPRAVVAAVAVARLRVGRGRGILRLLPRRRAVLRGRGGRGDRPSRSRRSRAS